MITFYIAGVDDCVLVLDCLDHTTNQPLGTFRHIVDGDELVGTEWCHL